MPKFTFGEVFVPVCLSFLLIFFALVALFKEVVYRIYGYEVILEDFGEDISEGWTKDVQ